MSIFRRKNSKPEQAQPKYWITPGGTYDVLASKALEAEHTLIAGYTGCGKSTFLRAILQAALVKFSPSEAQFIILDPKETDLWEMQDLPHVLRYAVSLTDCLSALRDAYNLMRARQTVRRQQGVEVYEGSAVYVIIDELNPILTNKYDRECRTESEYYIEQIVSLGRSANVHLIAATQNPNKKTIPANISDNCTCRFGLHCMTQEQSRQIVLTKGCEDLPKHGVTIAILNGVMGMYKLPYVTPQEMKPLYDYWMAQVA